ncbi:MAG: DHH family phosphoesterase [Alteromonadaceae bacterium]|nr:DHH family phosphoesterase [Alteromonadaceae bacterium]
MHYDVFNGDADGIIALIQLRLAQPQDAVLITGVKRDIALLQQVDVSKAQSVTVLDISLEKNNTPLTKLLNNNVAVFYVDHHRTGDISKFINNEHFTGLLNTDANTCTSLLVNDYLDNRFAYWAIAAAFGDNMQQSAQQLVNKMGLSIQQSSFLAELGVYINYNGYGASIEDLHFHPAELYKQLISYKNPLSLMTKTNSVFTVLKQAYQQDMAKAQSAKILVDTGVCKVVELANEPWARRVSGVFSNELANQSPDKAHAVLTLNPSSCRTEVNYTVSVRAPLNNKQGADEVCIQFATGGGRAGAAGINKLPAANIDEFVACLSDYYG